VQRKEVRIALGIVGCLLVIFAVALVWRLGFSGTPKTDEVAAAPDEDSKDKKKAAAAPSADDEHEEPTVLTATQTSSAAPKNAAAQTPAPAEPEADHKNRQRDYQHEPAEADPADYAADPPEPSPNTWGLSADQTTDAFAGSSPYGYGDESAEAPQQPEETAAPDQFAQHDSIAATPDAEAPPTGKSRGNPIRQQPQTNSSRGNPFRAAAPDADRAHDAAALTAAQEPRPNLHDDPAADVAAEAEPRGSASQPNALQNGWAITPAAQSAHGYEQDPVERIDDVAQSGVDAAAATAAPPPAPQRSTPQLLGNNAASANIQPTRQRAAPIDAVVPTSAETEATEAPPGFYRVAAGDTYWRISRAIYGDPGYYRALYEHNRQRFPRADKLPAGTELETPALATLEQMHPDFCPSKSGQ
jgi:nucleoid-associated protein YgaU